MTWQYEPDENPKRKHHWDREHAGFVTVGRIRVRKREGRQATDVGARRAARMREGGAAVDELVARSGDGDIEFALTWLPERSTATAAEATRGHLRVSLRGRAVWHGTDEDDGFE